MLFLKVTDLPRPVWSITSQETHFLPEQWEAQGDSLDSSSVSRRIQSHQVVGLVSSLGPFQSWFMTAEQGPVTSCEVGVVKKGALRSKDKTLQLRRSAPRLVPSVSEAIYLSSTNCRPRSHRQTQQIPVQPVKSRTNYSADPKLSQLAVGLSCYGLLWLLTHAKLTDPSSSHISVHGGRY